MNFIEEKKILKAETFLIVCIILGENMEACWERKTTKFIQHEILSKEIIGGAIESKGNRYPFHTLTPPLFQ